GYLIYEVKNRELTVREFIYLEEGARIALWSFLAQHDSMIEKVLLTAPVDDILPYLLTDPRIKHEVVPFAMARIVDVVQFVKKFPFAAGEEMDTMRLRIIDEHAPWNDGIFT